MIMAIMPSLKASRRPFVIWIISLLKFGMVIFPIAFAGLRDRGFDLYCSPYFVVFHRHLSNVQSFNLHAAYTLLQIISHSVCAFNPG